MSKKSRFLFVFFTLVLFFFIFSCHRAGDDRGGTVLNEHYRLLVRKAGQMQSTDPDSAILYADSAMALKERTAHNDTVLIPALRIKAQSWLSKGNSDSAISILLRASTFAVANADTLALAETSYKIADVLQDREDFKSSERYLQEAAALYTKLNNEYKTAVTWNLYANLFIAQGNNIKVQEYLMKAASVFERLECFKDLGVTYFTMARNFRHMDDRPNALKYYRLAISYLTREKDNLQLRSAYNNLGVFYRRSLPDSALACYRKAIDLLATGNPTQLPVIEMYNIANLFLDQKQYSRALEEYGKVLELSRRNHLAGGVARSYAGYAFVYEGLGKQALAASYNYHALRIADSLGEKSLSLKIRQTLLENYQKNKDYQAAMLISDTIKTLSDTVAAREKRLALRSLEHLHHAEKKVLENSALRASLLYEKKQSFYRWIIIVILFIALILMGYLVRKSTLLHTHLSHAYEVLMNRYKEDIEIRKKPLLSYSKLKERTGAGRVVQAPDNPLADQLVAWFNSEKPYLNPKLKVEEVALRLNTSQKAISLALKEYSNSNFNSFTNRFRVDAAIHMMDDPLFRNYKIEAIARDSGFGSKSNFYDTFESFTGVKPNYYRSRMTNKTPIDANVV
jgi:tetratricopeptide (TPR) repeat protein